VTTPLQTLYNSQYVIYDDNGERTKILCRKCGVAIADIIDIGKVRDPATGALVMRQGFRLLPNYTKVQLELSNNGEMLSAMCKRCAKHLGRDEINALYLSEIEAIQYDAVVHHKEAQMAPLVDLMLGLTVLRRVN
jgi:hypothetical protein